MVNVIINGHKMNVPKDYTILKACNDLGIHIPTLCHDDRIDPHAACRLCIVEIEGMDELPTSCSTKVKDGMKIRTHSNRVRKARKDILNLIVANHPLDCIMCDNSGNCKLQEYCYEYGISEVEFKGEKKSHKIDYSNPFYYSDQNKCINCGKCVRICNELQCVGAIGFNERGFKTHIGAPFDMELNESECVSCGNCVSVCPVGALMPKVKERIRYDELKKVRTTCPYCGVGCQMDLLVLDGKIVDVKPADGPSNENLLCVKGRFGFKFLDHPDRLKKPLIKRDGKFVESSWDEAYKIIAKNIKKIKDENGSDAFAGFSSARCSTEENYLFQKLFRAALGTNNVDHCARL